jgi:transposase
VRVSGWVGRPISEEVRERIREALAGGMSVRKAAARFKVNPSTVQSISRPFVGVGIAE